MSRNRFQILLKFIHASNNAEYVPKGEIGYDPLFKVREFYDMFREQLLDTHSPGQKLSLDEGMIGWRGNISFRVYLPDKSKRFGIKLFLLTEAKSSIVCD